MFPPALCASRSVLARLEDDLHRLLLAVLSPSPAPPSHADCLELRAGETGAARGGRGGLGRGATTLDLLATHGAPCADRRDSRPARLGLRFYERTISSSRLIIGNASHIERFQEHAGKLSGDVILHDA